MAANPSHHPLVLRYPLQNLFMIPLLAGSAALFGFGLFAPLMTVEKMIFFKNTVSVYSGIVQLYQGGEYFLFTVLLVFSVIFPALKLLMLFWLWFSPFASQTQIRYGKALFDALGKWSMLDVFVVALMVILLKLGILVKVQVHEGAYLFGSSVLLSMVTATLLGKVAKCD